MSKRTEADVDVGRLSARRTGEGIRAAGWVVDGRSMRGERRGDVLLGRRAGRDGESSLVGGAAVDFGVRADVAGFVAVAVSVPDLLLVAVALDVAVDVAVGVAVGVNVNVDAELGADACFEGVLVESDVDVEGERGAAAGVLLVEADGEASVLTQRDALFRLGCHGLLYLFPCLQLGDGCCLQ